MNFWATWCGPCREEIPELARRVAREPRRCFEMLGVAEESAREDVLRAASEIPYPVLLDERAEELGRWKVRGYPHTYIVDAEGKLRHVFEGGVRRRGARGGDPAASAGELPLASSRTTGDDEDARPGPVAVDRGRAARLPICGKPVPPRAENRSFPFCSHRCRLLDLGKWLGRGVPHPGAEPGRRRRGASAPGDARGGRSGEARALSRPRAARRGPVAAPRALRRPRRRAPAAPRDRARRGGARRDGARADLHRPRGCGARRCAAGAPPRRLVRRRREPPRSRRVPQARRARHEHARGRHRRDRQSRDGAPARGRAPRRRGRRGSCAPAGGPRSTRPGCSGRR